MQGGCWPRQNEAFGFFDCGEVEADGSGSNSDRKKKIKKNPGTKTLILSKALQISVYTFLFMFIHNGYTQLFLSFIFKFQGIFIIYYLAFKGTRGRKGGRRKKEGKETKCQILPKILRNRLISGRVWVPAFANSHQS